MLRSAQRGAHLIELMIGLAIVGVLLMTGVPAFTTFMQNQKLRATAETISAGLQLARAEAVKRNGRVELVLTDDDPVAAGVSSITASVSGKNWVVRYYDSATLFYQFVEGRSGSIGSSNLDATTVVVTATDATIPFNGFGATTLGAAATIQITNPTGGACAGPSGGPMRCLNVVISPGGQIRMCDPDSGIPSGDTRKC